MLGSPTSVLLGVGARGCLHCYKARKTISLKINRSHEIDGLEKFLGESLGPVQTVSNGSAHGRNSYALRTQPTHAPESRKSRGGSVHEAELPWCEPPTHVTAALSSQTSYQPSKALPWDTCCLHTTVSGVLGLILETYKLLVLRTGF